MFSHKCIDGIQELPSAIDARSLIVCTASMLAIACARPQIIADNTPLTPGPSSRQNATSSTLDRADASVQLSPTQGHTATGELRLMTEGEGVRLIGTITGLAPDSQHGIHIHEKGDCSAPDASSAGGHFNPLQHPHGPLGPGTHIGDLGNITANHAGVAYVDVRAVDAALFTSSVTDISGKAVIVHAKPDDLQTQPSGASGARIACGVIR